MIRTAIESTVGLVVRLGLLLVLVLGGIAIVSSLITHPTGGLVLCLVLFGLLLAYFFLGPSVTGVNKNSVLSVAFSPDGRWIASGSVGRTVKIWDISTGTLARVLPGHAGWVFSVAFSPDGRLIASGSFNRREHASEIAVRESETGALVLTLAVGDRGALVVGGVVPVFPVAFSPDGKRVASCAFNPKTNASEVVLWDVETGNLVLCLSGYKGILASFAFSPDGSSIVSGADDGNVRLWDAAAGTLLGTLTGHSGWVQTVAFSPDGRCVASGGADGAVMLWEVEAGTLMRTLTDHADSVNSVAFSPDGRLLASGSDDGTVKLWEAKAGTLLHTLTAGESSVSSVAFSPDGRWIAAGAPDGTIRLWNSETGTRIRTLPETDAS